MKIQKAYTETERPKIDTGEGLTEQAHKEECDMNYILRDYQKTGTIRHAKQHQGQYDDVSVQDFQEAILLVKKTQEMFEGLPSNIRKECNNNPAEFLKFAQNPNNKDRMQELGMLKGNDGLDRHGALTSAPKIEPTNEPSTEGSGEA